MSLHHDSVTAAVCAAIRQVLHDTGREPKALEPAMLLTAGVGLDSLDLAQTIVLLERALGVDPFRTPAVGAGRPVIRTLDDLVAVYAQAVTERASPKPS